MSTGWVAYTQYGFIRNTLIGNEQLIWQKLRNGNRSFLRRYETVTSILERIAPYVTKFGYILPFFYLKNKKNRKIKKHYLVEIPIKLRNRTIQNFTVFLINPNCM